MTLFAFDLAFEVLIKLGLIIAKKKQKLFVREHITVLKTLNRNLLC